jgi:hypothetical protein
MTGFEEQADSLLRDAEERERAARRRAVVYSFILILLFVFLLSYIGWQVWQSQQQIEIAQAELQAVRSAISDPTPGEFIVFNPPNEMTVQKEERITAVMVAERIVEHLGPVVRERPMPGPIMPLPGGIEPPGTRPPAVVGAGNNQDVAVRASLSATNFAIQALSPDFAFPNTGSIEWNWIVKPITPGSQQLFLSVTVTAPGRERSVYNTVIRRNIQVNVDQQYNVWLFLRENWQWLALAVVAFVAGWFLARRSRGNAPAA